MTKRKANTAKTSDPKKSVSAPATKGAGVDASEISEEALETVAGGTASTKLMEACATGTHIKDATITH